MPVRPKPVATSSQIRSTSCSRHAAPSARRPSGSASCMPAAPCTSGSTITAASSCGVRGDHRDAVSKQRGIAELRARAARESAADRRGRCRSRRRPPRARRWCRRGTRRRRRGTACGRRRRGSPSTGTRSSAPARPRRRRRTRRGSAASSTGTTRASASASSTTTTLPLPSMVECAPRSSCARTASSSSGDVVAEGVDPQRRDGVEVAATVDVDRARGPHPARPGSARSRRTRPSG